MPSGIAELSGTPGIVEFVILGTTADGVLFQPTGWSVGLCNMLATVGSDGRMVYSSYARPIIVEGISAVVVRASLQKVDPAAFELVKRFVSENRLKVRAGRGGRDAEATGPHPVLGMERRRTGPSGWQ
jgi:hypothetical protein